MIRRQTLLLCALAALSGCDSVLDVEPHSFSGTTNFYQNPSQVERAVIGAYSYLQDVYGSATGNSGAMWVFGELRSDNTTYQLNESQRFSQPVETVDEFLVTPDNSPVNGIWANSYEAILQSNAILGRIEGVAYTDQAAKERAIAEAKFLRALHYFNLVRLFGDVPLILTEARSYSEAFVPERTPAEKVYAQIVQDLEGAIAGLPARSALPATQAGRATRGAATMLLADVHMTRKSYAAAASALESVLGMGYSLVASYGRIFDPAAENGPESILEVQFSEGVVGESSAFVYRFVPFNSGADLIYGFRDLGAGGAGWNLPTRDLVRAYEAGDSRKAATIGFYVKPANRPFSDVAIGDTIPYLEKFRHPFGTPGRTDQNFVVYRYAEALLLYAEALNELGRTAEAYEPVNRVRTRAGLGPLAPGLGQAAFRDAVLKEQRLELAGESKRWFQLVRTGRAVPVMNAHGAQLKGYTNRRPPPSYQVQPFMQLFPIPLREVTVNGLEQNQGY